MALVAHGLACLLISALHNAEPKHPISEMRQTINAVLLAMFLAALGNACAQEKAADYRLGPGDAIRILVFQNPDLTLESRISESGTIT